MGGQSSLSLNSKESWRELELVGWSLPILWLTAAKLFKWGLCSPWVLGVWSRLIPTALQGLSKRSVVTCWPLTSGVSSQAHPRLQHVGILGGVLDSGAKGRNSSSPAPATARQWAEAPWITAVLPWSPSWGQRLPPVPHSHNYRKCQAILSGVRGPHSEGLTLILPPANHAVCILSLKKRKITKSRAVEAAQHTWPHQAGQLTSLILG